jgi:hypothetical protein
VVVKYAFFEAEFGKLPVTELANAKNRLIEFLDYTNFISIEAKRKSPVLL